MKLLSNFSPLLKTAFAAILFCFAATASYAQAKPYAHIDNTTGHDLTVEITTIDCRSGTPSSPCVTTVAVSAGTNQSYPGICQSHVVNIVVKTASGDINLSTTGCSCAGGPSIATGSVGIYNASSQCIAGSQDVDVVIW